MSYSITAENLVGAISLHREDVSAALKKARELRRDGMWNVRIADDDGKVIEEERASATVTAVSSANA